MIRLPGLGGRAGKARASERLAFRAVARNSAWSLAGAGVSALAVFAETVLLAHYLGPAAFGTFVLVVAYPEAVQQLLDFRVRDAMTRYLADFIVRGRNREAVAVVKLLWLIDVTVAAFSLVIVLFTAGLAAGLLIDDSSLGRLMRIYAIGQFFGSLDTASGPVLRVLDRFKLSFIAGSGSAILRLGLVAAVIIGGGSLEQVVWARVIAEFARTLLQGGISLYALLPTVWEERRAPISVLRGSFREIGGFLANTNIASTLTLASSKLDKIILGVLASPSTVGLYKVATQFGTAPQLVNDALETAVYPAFTRAFARDRKAEIRHVARQATFAITALLVPLGAAMAFKSGFLMDLLAGKAFHAAGTPFAICLAGVIPFVVFFWLRSLLLTTGHAGALVRMASVGTLLQFAVLFMLVPVVGVTGAAIAFAGRYILVLLLQLQFVSKRKLLDVPKLGKPALSGVGS
jgi:O-antigen/teichoic acid export membrane protein